MKISFVVPTRNSGRTIASCLRSLRDQRHRDTEVLVVDNDSTDATVAVAGELADRVVQAGPERSAQRNRGYLESTGEVVVFVDSDMVLEPEVARAIAGTFSARPDLGALTIPERSFGTGFFARCRAFERSRYVGDASVEAPRAFRRSTLAALGGWDEELCGPEDWDLADRATAAGTGTGRIGAWIWHDEGRVRLSAAFAKKRYYGRCIDSYLRKHGSAGRKRLVRTSLVRRPGSLARHPLLTAGMVVLKATEAAGALAGMRDARREETTRELSGVYDGNAGC